MILNSTILFVIGLFMGSFFVVVGLRLPKKENFVTSRSKCPKCRKILTYKELIPIFSYLFQKGKCAKCHKKISVMYPIMELMTGVLFAISYLVFGFSSYFAIALILSSSFIIIIVSDVKYTTIPDEVLLISVIAIIAIFSIFETWEILIHHIISACILFSLMFLLKLFGNFLFKKESLGDGDIKLMIVVGLVLQPFVGVLSIVLAALIALPYAVIIMKKNGNHEIPFGPFLMASCLILFFMQIDYNSILDMFIVKL